MSALRGIRVVELTAGMAGPWIGRFMAWCGAEVVKIESTKYPDVTRLYVPPRQPELGVQPELSPWFTDWNAGKRFVALDLTKPAAVTLAKRLIAISDVVVENYSTGVLDKLGLGYAQLRAAQPALVMLSSSGYGDSGPCARYVSWGPNIEALSGLSTLSGFPERSCTITQFAYPDPLSALHGLFAVLCALDHRRRSQQGQHIRLAQYEATVAALGPLMMEYLANGRTPERLGNRSRQHAPHGCYRCAGEDRWCAISITNETQWQSFAAIIDRPELTADARFSTIEARRANHIALDAIIEQWTSTRSDDEVMNILQNTGITAGVVQNIADQLQRDPQLAARHFFEEIPHKRKGTVIANGIPLGLTGTPGHTSATGSAIGQDNDYVFGDLLGISESERQQMIEDGVIER